ncbi:MAG: hypothetical protein KKG47_14970 [Proteobacteria bacterium]|nr:hypothetical protein [Pseudomonadota bacterium]MBU1738842.1 hypothetical protein [Pseudomonadota bacterium]
MNTAHIILEKILPDSFKSHLDLRFPAWHAAIDKSEIQIKIWLEKLLSELVKNALLAVVVSGAYIAGLYFLRGSWHLFANTLMGSQYINSVDVARASEISRVLSLEFKKLSFTIILLAITTSGVAGIISQLTMLRRFFYVGRSPLVKLFWMGLASGMVAHRLTDHYHLELHLSFSLCLLPTAVLFSSILASVGKLLPELNVASFMQNYRERKEIQALKDDLARLQNEGPEK